jgi:thiosulfate/3-mercaptopyruvate sulfurtransferase
LTSDYINADILIETEDLEPRLSSPDLRVIDCNLDLSSKPEGGYLIASGRPQWERAHIPNSCYIDLHQELSLEHPSLRFMLPTPDQFAQVLSRHGVGDGHEVVVYSRGSNMWATRLFLMFLEFGFTNVRVLNGGWDKWEAEKRPLSTRAPGWPPARFTASAPAGHFVGKERVLAAIGDARTCVVNALPRESFSGATLNPTYGRPGRIKSSVNLPASELIDPRSNRFLEADRMRKKFAQANILEAENVITYCGGGISATTDAFGLLLLGRSGVAVYDGSMMEWGPDPDLPMEKD